MSEFRIEKVRRRVSVALAAGAALEGEIFLQPAARYRTGPQHPAEMLNEPDPFFPLSIGDELVLVAKEQVLRLQFEADAADTDLEGVAEALVDVLFPDGSVSSGALRLETRLERPRLLDYLNDESQRFITLRSPQGICLINRRQIAQVRPRR
jgi:hypothetical protein